MVILKIFKWRINVKSRTSDSITIPMSNKKQIHNRWTDHDRMLLAQLVQASKNQSPYIQWTAISSFFKNRTAV